MKDLELYLVPEFLTRSVKITETVPTSNTVTDSKGNPYTLYYSTNSGEADLTVGFYIQGPKDLITYKKLWDFGDGHVEKNLDIVANRFYGPDSIGEITFSVTILDYVTEKPITDPMTCIINISKHPTPSSITNFYQTEGVIYAGSYAGFSLATGTTADGTTWYWGDSAQDTEKPNMQNPNHQYQSKSLDPPFCGTVILGDPSSPSDTWKFAVMVLQNPTDITSGFIDIQVTGIPNPPTVSVDQSVTLTAETSPNLQTIFGQSANYAWDFPMTSEQEKSPDGIMNGVVPIGPVGRTSTWKFPAPGNYHIRCHIRDDTGVDLHLSTTLIVVKDNL